MKITVGNLRRLVNEAAPRAPEDLARGLMTMDSFDAGRQMVPRNASPEQIAAAAAEHALDVSVSASERARLGKAYMARLTAALIALAMREFDLEESMIVTLAERHLRVQEAMNPKQFAGMSQLQFLKVTHELVERIMRGMAQCFIYESRPGTRSLLVCELRPIDRFQLRVTYDFTFASRSVEIYIELDGDKVLLGNAKSPSDACRIIKKDFLGQLYEREARAALAQKDDA